MATGLRRIGVDGDGLVWMTGRDWLPADAVAALIRNGRAAGLAVVIGVGSAAAAAELAGLAPPLVHRICRPVPGGGGLGRPLAGVGWDAVGRAGRVRAGGERAATSVGDPRAAGARRLPRPGAAGQERLWRRLRYDPA